MFDLKPEISFLGNFSPKISPSTSRMLPYSLLRSQNRGFEEGGNARIHFTPKPPGTATYGTICRVYEMHPSHDILFRALHGNGCIMYYIHPLDVKCCSCPSVFTSNGAAVVGLIMIKFINMMQYTDTIYTYHI